MECSSIVENALELRNPSRLPVEWRIDDCLACASSVIWASFWRTPAEGSPPVGRYGAIAPESRQENN